MQVGDQLGGRWRVLATAPSRDAVERWRAVDEHTAEPVELLVLRASRADAGARRAFVAAHESLIGAIEPGVVPTLQIHREGDDVVAVRVPTEDASLADLRGPIDVGVVASVGAELIPAVIAAGPATRGALLASDVGLNAQGRPVLAPHAAPLTRVVRGTTRAVAPEAFEGATPDGAAGLYGLGVLLYRLATGREPLTSATGAPPPPPSVVRHGIPPAFDEAIARLLSRDPSARAAALPLLQDLAAPPEDLRSRARPRAVTGQVIVGTERADRSAQPGTRHDTDPVGLVLIPAGALAQLDPDQQSLAAGLAGVPLAVIHALKGADLPLVIEGARSRAAARQRARQLADQTELPVSHGIEAGLPPSVHLTTTILVALLPLLGTLITGIFGLLIVAVPLFVILLVIIAIGGGLAYSAARRRRLHRAGLEGLARSRTELAARGADGLLAPIWARLAELRVQLGSTELPPTAAADLRGILKGIEDRLDALARRARSADDTLRQVDATALSTRLKALSSKPELSPAESAERDRLARTVADLDAVKLRRRSVAEESSRIRDALSEIAAVLGQLGEDPGEEILSRLSLTVRAAEAVVSEPGGAAARHPHAATAQRIARQVEG